MSENLEEEFRALRAYITSLEADLDVARKNATVLATGILTLETECKALKAELAQCRGDFDA
jgi:phage shock protein A